MSGVVKSVGKVFRKVAKPVAKILPAALAVGALVFTAGAALGALPTWGAAMSQMSSSLGLSSTLTNVLGGALTQAGYGAAVGAAGSLLTGGDPMKGAQYGAAAGAVTGGLMGGLGYQTDPLSSLNSQGGGSSQSVMQGGAGGDSLAPGEMTGTPGVDANAPINAAQAPSVAPQESVGGGGLMGKGGWLERNQTLAGGVLKGVGEAAVKGMAANDAGEANLALLRERQAIIRSNYSGSGGLLTTGQTAGAQVARPTPSQRFDPSTYEGQYVYDPQLGRIVFVPTSQQQA